MSIFRKFENVSLALVDYDSSADPKSEVWMFTGLDVAENATFQIMFVHPLGDGSVKKGSGGTVVGTRCYRIVAPLEERKDGPEDDCSQTSRGNKALLRGASSGDLFFADIEVGRRRTSVQLKPRLRKAAGKAPAEEAHKAEPRQQLKKKRQEDADPQAMTRAPVTGRKSGLQSTPRRKGRRR